MGEQNLERVTRTIKRSTERELWARSAGRCEFNGCNKTLYKSTLTQERVNISEKAHIYSFSEKGTRGWGPLFKRKNKINDIENLLLVCHSCHKTIDTKELAKKYSAKLLRSWKNEHENRVAIVTGITIEKRTHIVIYESNIGEQKSCIQDSDAMEAIFPNRYPISENAIRLSMLCSHEDCSPDFWKVETEHLCRIFTQRIVPILESSETKHFSLFSLAPIPLLIKLGSLFTDKISVDTYQPMREPKGWHWQKFPEGFEFVISEPSDLTGMPVLIISLSAKIDHKRVKEVVGGNISIWELTVPGNYIGNDNIRSESQLSMFRNIFRRLMILIKDSQSDVQPLSIFPAMSVSCSIEMGRVRMPKADIPWIIYDQNNKEGRFVKAIKIE